MNEPTTQDPGSFPIGAMFVRVDDREATHYLYPGYQNTGLVPVEPPNDIDDPHPQLVWLYWDEEHAESRWKPLREVTE